MYEEYADIADRIAPFVADTALLLNRAIRDGKSVMFEGAQGTMLDIDHGTYPFVTSSSATSGGASIGTGVPPNSISTVIGVTKAYCTRVGEGPFPSEIQGEIGAQIQTKGSEFGAVTGRPRRCGWLDLPLLRYSNMINGTGWLVVTKLDVLDELAEIPIVTGYKIDGKTVEEIPAQDSGYRKIEPILTTLPGWQQNTYGTTEHGKLPKKAQEYLRFVQKESEAAIGMISTGPDRDHTIFVDEFSAILKNRSRHDRLNRAHDVKPGRTSAFASAPRPRSLSRYAVPCRHEYHPASPFFEGIVMKRSRLPHHAAYHRRHRSCRPPRDSCRHLLLRMHLQTRTSFAAKLTSPARTPGRRSSARSVPCLPRPIRVLRCARCSRRAVLRIVPSSALAGLVAPISLRQSAIALAFSSASTTTGPEVMNAPSES